MHRQSRMLFKAVIIIAISALSGCTTWKAQSVAPTAAPEKEQTERLRVTLRTGERIDLELARVSGDSIIGTLVSPGRQSERRLAYATSEVQKVEVRKTNVWLSTVLVATGLFLFGALYAGGPGFFVGVD